MSKLHLLAKICSCPLCSPLTGCRDKAQFSVEGPADLLTYPQLPGAAHQAVEQRLLALPGQHWRVLHKVDLVRLGGPEGDCQDPTLRDDQTDLAKADVHRTRMKATERRFMSAEGRRETERDICKCVATTEFQVKW